MKKKKKAKKKSLKKAKKIKKVKIKKVKKAKKLKKAKKAKKSKKTKRALKKTAVKKVSESEPVLPWRTPLEGEKFLGIIDDYYQHVSVIALYLKEPLRLGERIHIRGFSTDFTQIVSSIQIEHNAVESAEAGAGVGIKVDQKAHKGNYAYKVI